MKIDMHCHVKEGSIDSRVGIEEYITILKEHGFQGMVITDHDTYNGYRYWKKNLKGKKHTDFVVLKGIEYDTRDAGHILVIMPEGVKMRLLEMRGMPLALLIDLVHRNGGVLGPAHPCGEKYMSFTHARRYYLSPEIVKRFDFIETFNCCEPKDSNAGALKLAEKYSPEKLEQVCAKALSYSAKPSYKSIKNLLAAMKDSPDDISNASKESQTVEKPHGITRGARYYGGKRS